MLEERDAHAPALAEIRDLRSWTEHPWKLIESERGSELYHLEEDPRERVDLAEQRPEVVERLRKAMLDHVRREGPGFVSEVELDSADETLRKQLEALGYLGD